MTTSNKPASGTPASTARDSKDTPPQASTALRGRERLRPQRPEWAAAETPAHRRPLPLITREALEQSGTAATRKRLVDRNQSWYGTGWSPEMAELRERGSAIRRETLRDLEGYLSQLTENVEAAGGRVHRARTSDEAVSVISGIARDNGVRLAVKSKSMVTEEIHLSSHLNALGVDVVETDLGEYIVQLADERPAHIVAPAVHKSRADVQALFEQLAGEELRGEPEALTGFARQRLREDFHAADMGISGVNFAAADTGTITLVTNEGNARMVTSQPRIHVAVMTVEKVIPRLEDLGTLIPLLTHAATYATVSGYQTMLTGPRRADEQDGPDELHLVIVDNGRSELVGGKYEDVLACIRCGACQTACPVFRTVGGGHSYASVYGGPIGAVLTPLIGDPDEGDDLPFLSSLCGACGDVCPVKIPLPDMLVDLRADYVARHQTEATSRLSRAGWSMWSRVWNTRTGYLTSLGGARIGGWLPAGLLSRAGALARGWASGRSLPSMSQAGQFRAWFRRHQRADGTKESKHSE